MINRTYFKVLIVYIILKVIMGYPVFYDTGFQERSLISKELIEPTEIQNAMCNIVTDQIKATANATITRQLKGVCHAKEVREQLRHIEVKLLREIHKIHHAVQNLATQGVRKSVVFKYLPNKP